MGGDSFRWYVGVDLGAREHQVCVTDALGEVILERKCEHSTAGVLELVQILWDRCQGLPQDVAVGLEAPHGAVCEALLERGFAVFSINPKQLDRFRDRYSMAGAKDDSRDALVAASSLRTDLKLFHRIEPEPAGIVRLREATRRREELLEQERRLCNQLTSTLQRFRPGMLEISSGADDAFVWDLLELAPSATATSIISLRKIQGLTRVHRIRRISPERVREILRQAPLPVAPGVGEACESHVRSLLPRIRLVHQLRQQAESEMQQLLDGMKEPEDDHEARDVAVLLSLPGIGVIIAATLLAEGHAALAHRDYAVLRTLGGLAPVTRQSGKSRMVVMRRACNARLRNVFYHLARSAALHDEGIRKRYEELRERGLGHARALRGLADRLAKVLVAMLRDGQQYQPARFAARLKVA